MNAITPTPRPINAATIHFAETLEKTPRPRARRAQCESTSAKIQRLHRVLQPPRIRRLRTRRSFRTKIQRLRARGEPSKVHSSRWRGWCRRFFLSSRLGHGRRGVRGNVDVAVVPRLEVAVAPPTRGSRSASSSSFGVVGAAPSLVIASSCLAPTSRTRHRRAFVTVRVSRESTNNLLTRPGRATRTDARRGVANSRATSSRARDLDPVPSTIGDARPRRRERRLERRRRGVA